VPAGADATIRAADARGFVAAEAEAGARLDVVLAARLGVGRGAVRSLLSDGAVRVDGHRVGLRDKGLPLAAGSRVEVAGFTAPAERRVRPEPDAPLVVCAEGPGWVAVEKPAGRAVHPLREDEPGSLLAALAALRPEVQGVGEGGLRSGVVHRLDVGTSGVVLFATEQATWERLREAFRSGRVEKTYRALVVGRMEGEGAVALDLAVARHRPARVRVVGAGAAPTPAGARRTSLRWRALAPGRDASLLEVHPRTGFLHQIRVSLAHLGHPVCGDPTYGRPDDPSGAPRQMLHAARLRFEEVEAASPDPPDLADAIVRWIGPGPW
jgi:23S rRNA pseudouridine1911/1915/1917 synthase